MKLNLKGISKTTWVRLIVMLLVLVNEVSVVFFKHKLIPLTDTQLNTYISTGATVIGTIWVGWKNNSVTAHAQEADKVLNDLKGGEK